MSGTMDLRARLITADGFKDTLAAYRADWTLPIVAEWLRDKAAQTRAVADLLPAMDEHEAVGAAKMLDFLAESLIFREERPS